MLIAHVSKNAELPEEKNG